MTASSPSPRVRTALTAAAVALAYYAAAQLGVVLRLPPATTSVMWPPNSLLTAVLLLSPMRRWPLYLAAAFPAHLLALLQAGFPLPFALPVYLTNCGEALLAAWLMHRTSDAPARFDTLDRVTSFLGSAVMLSPLVTSFADAAVVHFAVGEPYLPVLFRRFCSNSLSALVIVPSIVMVVTQGGSWLREASWKRWLEAGVLALALGAVAHLVFAGQQPSPDRPHAYTSLPFLIPVLMLAAVRFGPPGASLGMLLTTLAAIRAATLGWKPFSPLSAEESVVALQMFVGVVGAPLLYLGALLDERRRATAALVERLRFEEVLAQVAGEFVHGSRRQTEDAFEAALARLGAAFDADRVSLRRISESGQELALISVWAAEPAVRLPATVGLPWSLERLQRGDPIVIASPEDWPPEASRERQLMEDHGVGSCLVLPLVGGERVLGWLAFLDSRRGRVWPEPLRERGRLFADVFASALVRRLADDALRASEARQTAVLASLTSHVAVLDRQGRVVAVNESWVRMMQAEAAGSPEAADGAEALGGVGSDHLEYWRTLAERGSGEGALAAAGIAEVLGGARPAFVMEYASPSRPERWYVITVVPLQAREGGAVVSLADVSERKRAELEAQKSRQELAHFLRVSTIGELTSSLAHELNQPLTAILANAQVAARLVGDARSPATRELRAILADLVADGRRASEVIGRLRELLRKGEPELLPLEANALVREVVELLASDAVIRGVTTRLELHPELLVVHGDRVQLQQVLLNVLLNAMEAMAEGGRIVVSSARAADASVRIAISDTGPGLPETMLGRAFEPFHTTKPGGLGMGLSIARSILEAHGGSIAAANNPVRGATFTLTLPAASSKRPAPVERGTGQPAAVPAEPARSRSGEDRVPK